MSLLASEELGGKESLNASAGRHCLGSAGLLALESFSYLPAREVEGEAILQARVAPKLFNVSACEKARATHCTPQPSPRDLRIPTRPLEAAPL